MSPATRDDQGLSVYASIEHLIEALLTPENVASVLRTATTCLAEITDIEQAGVAALDHDGTQHWILRNGESRPRPLQIGSPTAYVAEIGLTLQYPLAAIPPTPEGYDPQIWLSSHDHIQDFEQLVILPLVASNRPRGAMWLLSNETGRFDPWFLEQARALAAVIAMALERAHESERAQEQLETIRQANEVLAASNREFEDFAQMASSDLQNPLRKIIGFGDRLEKSAKHSLTERELDYLSRIHNASDRMQRLINDLLQFSCVHAADAPHEAVDLNWLMVDVMSDLEVALVEAGGKLKVGQLPVVHGNEIQLHQVFQNLVGNAIKFSVDGRPPAITVEHVPSDDGLCHIEVVDNGIGFDMSFHDRIFKPFQRLHGVQEYQGSGIGLSICRRIVERHDGGIEAMSVVGEGTRFVVQLQPGAQD